MFDKIVAFLTPRFLDEEERKSALLNAFNNSEVVLGKINTVGSSSVFVPRLVRVLQHYGEISPGTQALWQFLHTMKGQGGIDQDQIIDSFHAWANTAHPVPLDQADLTLPPVVNNPATNSIRIGGNVTGGNVNIGGTQTVYGNVTVTISSLTETIQQGTAEQTEKAILQNMVYDLTLSLKSVPAAQKTDADKVAERTKELVSAVSAAPVSADAVEAKAGMLKIAADKLKNTLPDAAHHGDRIVGQALKMIEAK